MPVQMTWQLFASQRPDRPAVAVSLNRDLARIQGWCNHLCMILNPTKTKALVVSRSRTGNPHHGDLVLSGVSIRASPNLDIHGEKIDSKLTFGPCAWYCFPCGSENWYFEVGETIDFSINGLSEHLRLV